VIVGHIKAAVPQVEALIEALCTTPDNDQRFPRKWGDPCFELAGVHKAAFAQLLQLSAKWKRVEVVAHW